MQLSTVLLLLFVTLFLMLILYTEETESLYPYTIRGFVADVRNHPFRFIGGLFFKKAFLLKKLKLKWKLKKKFVLKKLLKKLFFGWNKLGLNLSRSKALLPQIFAQYNRRYKGVPYYLRGIWGEVRNNPPQQQQQHLPPQFLDLNTVHYHHHRHFYVTTAGAAVTRLQGRKRRAVRFPDEDANGSSGSSGSSAANSHFISRADAQYDHHPQQQGSGGSRTFFDDEFAEFQSIGLGQQELEMLRQLPENLQWEYRQEMQDLETSASEPREQDIMEYLTVTNEFDSDHCIAKGICEVMARGNGTSNAFEKLLLDYYNEEPETRKDPKGAPAYIYDYAAFLGKSRRDSRACASYFPKCPEPTTQLTGFMNDIFSSEMCDPPVHNEL